LNESINKSILLVASGIYFWICIAIKPLVDNKFPIPLPYLLIYFALAVIINLIIFNINWFPKSNLKK
jgi:hypothetical protein